MEDLQIKEKYGEVLKIEVEGKKIYLKKPNRYQLSPVFAKLHQDPIFAFELLCKACVIEEVSDMEVIENDSLFLSIMPELNALVDLKKSTSKML